MWIVLLFALALSADSKDDAFIGSRRSYWAFRVPLRPPVPEIRNVGNPIDAFLLDAMRQKGVSPSPPLDRSRLLRRVTLDLTGLPPTPAELQAFLRDRTPQAYAKVVDRLLASPRYGERWALRWLDVVRYADTNGYEIDAERTHAWRYRDYVVNAFNADKPYDRFMREQIAGDELYPGDAEALIATGFHRAGPIHLVAGNQDEEMNRQEVLTEMAGGIASVYLGLTVGCARCHNHKFDAISQTDFYSLFGIFSSTHPAVIDVSAPNRGQAERAELMKLKQQIKAAVGNAWLKIAESLPKKESKNETKPVDALKRLDLRKDKWFADGNGVKQGATQAGEFSIALESNKIIAQIHPGGVFSDLISTKDRGVLMSEHFKCEGGTLWIRAAGGGLARVRYIVDNYPRTGTIHKAKEFKDAKEDVLGWHKLDLDYWKDDDIFIEATTAADMPAETKIDERSWFGITDVVITKSTEPPPNAPISGDALEAVEAWMNNTMTDAQAGLLDTLLRSGKLPNDEKSVSEAAPLLAKYRDLEARLPLPTRAPGVLEADGHDAALFVRGDHKQPAELVPRRFLDGIDARPYFTGNDGTLAVGKQAPSDDKSGVIPSNSGRLQLAQSLTNPANPLTSRVIVNRIWHHVFGRGIVATTDNFGKLGDLPTHPELLDYLAKRFDESGGSIKDMIKFLVTSQTFQLDDRARAGAAEKDPENKLLSHFSVRRLEAEAIRDSILALTGKLDDTMYGESVGGADMRRSVYVKVIRNNLDDFLTVFDVPVPISTRGRRDATNVPAQSLTMLNSLRIKDWATRWGTRIAAQGGDKERVRRMFAEALGREPTRDELNGCVAFVQQCGHASDQENARLAKLDEQAKVLRDKIEKIFSPARSKLAAAHSKDAPVSHGPLPDPYAEWDFKNGTQDLKGHLPLELVGNARIEHGALVLDDGKSFARSRRLANPLSAKTLEAWVMLDNLDQSGGGVLTVQDLHGEVFDSIVFAEKQAQCWMAGSNFSTRTKPFNGSAEQEAAQRAVHIAIVYQADGTITGYRDGAPYGASYQSGGPAAFEANASEVLIGCRHGGGGGNKVLHGRVLRARLYDRALNADEVAASRFAEQTVVTEHDVLETLDESQRKDMTAWQKELGALNEKLRSAREQAERLDTPQQAWGNLALSLINLKEFIYLK